MACPRREDKTCPGCPSGKAAVASRTGSPQCRLSTSSCLVDVVGADAAEDCRHLVLMLHGLGGQPSDFREVITALKQQLVKAALHGGFLILRPRVTQDTTRGVEHVARRVLALVSLTIAKHAALKECSIMGLSLGGIYGRYLAKLMADTQLIGSEESGAALRANTFLTIASPHLGVRRFRTSGLGGLFDSVFQFFVPTFAGNSGMELLLEDKQQLLRTMAGKHFLSVLSGFRQRVCYANVQNDPQVPFWTGAMEFGNLFENDDLQKLPRLVDHPSILAVQFPEKGNTHQNAPMYALDPKGDCLDEMRANLNSLGWRKHYVCLPLLPNAHNQIIGITPGDRGKDVARHIALQMLL